MKTVSVVIPIYNEPSLERLLSELDSVREQLGELSLGLELIFVDDGSDSRQSLEQLVAYKKEHKRVRILRLARNFGSFQAIKAGFGEVTGDCFAMLAADLQDPPKLIVDMARKWQAGAKFVICVRGERDDPVTTRFFAALYYRMIRRFAIADFPSSGYDLSLMDTVMLPHLLEASVQVNFRLLAYWLGIEPERITYKRLKREAGETHWGLGKRINLFFESLIAFSNWPGRALASVGVLTGGVSKVLLLITLWQNWGNLESAQFNIGILVLILLGSVGLLGLGLIADYLYRIFNLAARKPEVVIAEKY
jgi:dolichol-phosphate mannosyltransferase